MNREPAIEAIPAAARGPGAARDAVDPATSSARRPGYRIPKGPYLNLIVLGNLVADGDRRRPPASPARSASTPSWVSRPCCSRIAASLYAPVTTTTTTTIGGQTFPPGTYSVPQPTPAEIRRQTFWMEFVGHYSVGAPRFSEPVGHDPHLQQRPRRRPRTSRSTPAPRSCCSRRPTRPHRRRRTIPMAGQVAGLLSFFPANALQSGSSLFAEITNLPGVASNDPSMLDHGLPAQVQFIVDPGGVTGGLYSTPAYTVTTAVGPVRA